MGGMDGPLIPIDGPKDSVPELIALVTDLRQDVAALRAQVQGLQRENLELRQQVGYWKSRHRDALGRSRSRQEQAGQRSQWQDHFREH